MSQEQVIDIAQRKAATRDMDRGNFDAIRTLGFATLDLYEKLEKIPQHSVLKGDALELYNQVDTLIAFFRDEPWKSKGISEKTGKISKVVKALAPFISEFPKQIKKATIHDAYVLKALQSFCQGVLLAEKQYNQLSATLRWFIKKAADLDSILVPFGQISKALHEKAKRLKIDLKWEEPPPPSPVPVIEESIIEEVFEETIAEIKSQEDILERLKAIDKVIQGELNYFDEFDTDDAAQIRNKELLSELIKANSIVSLNGIMDTIQGRPEQVLVIENNTELSPILKVIKEYLSEGEIQAYSAEFVQQLSFEELVTLYEQIPTARDAIERKINSIKEPSRPDIEEPVEPKESDSEDSESAEETPPQNQGFIANLFAGNQGPTEVDKLKQKHQKEIREEQYNAAVQVYQSELKAYQSQLKAFELETQHYNDTKKILEQDSDKLKDATITIGGILKNAAEKKTSGLEILRLRLKDLEIKPIVEQLEEQREEQRLLPPKELTRAEKIRQFFEDLIKAVINPLIIIWEIIGHLKNKFKRTEKDDSAKNDSESYYLVDGSGSEHQKSSTNKVVKALSESPRSSVEEEDNEEVIVEAEPENSSNEEPQQAAPVDALDGEEISPLNCQG